MLHFIIFASIAIVLLASAVVVSIYRDYKSDLKEIDTLKHFIAVEGFRVWWSYQ